MHMHHRPHSLRRSLGAIITLLVVMRALVAPPCEHHAMAHAQGPTSITGAAAHSEHNADNATNSHASHDSHNPGAAQPSEPLEPSHSNSDSSSHSEGCTCIGNCTTGTPTFLPAPAVSISAAAPSALNPAPEVAVIRIADRSPHALPWATAPPV